MKNIIKIILLISTFHTSCGFLNQLDNIPNIIVLVFPDSCDISFIEQIAKYRIDSLHFPDNNDIDFLKDSLNSECKDSYDSIKFKTYNIDSVDFIVNRKYNDTINSEYSYLKNYRIVFSCDTIIEVRILHLDKILNEKDEKEYELGEIECDTGVYFLFNEEFIEKFKNKIIKKKQPTQK